ncbi:TPA: hypothetical protein N0F65_002634 [Lagenidium giganteum]|uniref:CCHC-type domain-containing protein n=1 Tax=Lagenidium giganteum TaxID=4803 RepID=A0AAV2Z643_9STRA|nr:TPA: hypothetical protein N0F65_002634 [Lagenidium giganteum]
MTDALSQALPTPGYDELTSAVVDLMNQNRLVNQQSSQQLRLDNAKLPQYGGAVHESLRLYWERMDSFFKARNIAWYSPSLSQQIVAALGGTLKNETAEWFMAVKHDITTVEQFYEGLKTEFVPPDMQERLRDRLAELDQNRCKNLLDYIGKTKEEVEYLRPRTLQEAIRIAMDFDRSHYSGNPREHRDRRDERRGRRNGQRRGNDNDGAEPMEIDSAKLSIDECIKKGLCFECKERGHRRADCPKKQAHERKKVHFKSNHVTEVEVGTMDAPVTFDEFTIATVNEMPPKASNLLIKTGTIDGTEVKIMFDTGATTNLLRPGIAKKVVAIKDTSARRFDGTETPKFQTNIVEATVEVEGSNWGAVDFVEWDLSRDFDAIVGAMVLSVSTKH